MKKMTVIKTEKTAYTGSLVFNRQAGASTLLVVFLLLIVLIIPAVAAMRSTRASQQMATSSSDRARVFQAAELALAEAEGVVSGKPQPPASGCSEGVCAIPNGSPVWQENTNFWSGSSPRVLTKSGGVDRRFIIEFLGKSQNSSSDCTTSGDVSPDAKCESETSRYRVTVRAKSDIGAEVILQSNFLVP